MSAFLQTPPVPITPQLAREMLATRQVQRPLDKGRVQDYLAMMLAGLWTVTPDGIGFDVNGCLTNGQHRLEALILSGLTLPFYVHYGLPLDSFLATDRGKTRTHRDALSAAGHPNANILAGVLKITGQFQRGPLTDGLNRYSWEPAQSVAEAARDRHRYDEAARIGARSKQKGRLRGLISGAEIGAAFYIYSRADQAKTEAFIERLGTGLGILSSNDPAGLLRQRLIANATSLSKLGRSLTFALLVKALNAEMRGDRPRILKYSPEQERYPQPLAPPIPFP